MDMFSQAKQKEKHWKNQLLIPGEMHTVDSDIKVKPKNKKYSIFQWTTIKYLILSNIVFPVLFWQIDSLVM